MVKDCTSLTGQQTQCIDAQNACNNVDIIYGNYYPDFDSYNIRQKGPGPYFPPDTEVTYLQDPKVMAAIGAKATYSECPLGPSYAFASTADCMALTLPMLSSV